MCRFAIVCIDYEEKDAMLYDNQRDNQWFFQFNGGEPTLMDAYDYIAREYTMPEDFLDELAKECDDIPTESKPRKTFKEILDSTEVADMIAVESLKWHLNYLTERNVELFAMDPTEPHHLEEIIDNEKYKDALRLILGMFGVKNV